MVVAVYAALYAFGVLPYAPSEQTLYQWDVGWYESIRDGGYKAVEGAQSNLAFFPLFPYLWRLLGFGRVEMGLFNMGLLLLGGALFGRTFGLQRREVALLLSVPLLFFCFVPYTEALFFLFGVLMLRGLHRQQLGLTMLGLLGCCLVRAAATLFVPALVLTELVACTSKAAVPLLLRRLGGSLLAMAATLGLVMYLHYQNTGDPLFYIQAVKHWSHEPRWPLPSRLHSSAGIPVIGFDLLAMLIGCLSVLGGLFLGVRWLVGWRRLVPPAAPSRAIIFSVCYCAGIALVILLYQEGDLANSSRYVLATPFFSLLLLQLARLPHLSRSRRWQLLGIGGAAALGLAIWCGWPARFPGFFPAEAHFFFACWAAYLGLYVMAFSSLPYQRELRTGLYIINIVCQALLLNLFLAGTWIG